MSMYLNFEPHDWLMGWAINQEADDNGTIWRAYTDNGETYTIDLLESDTLEGLKAKIRASHTGTGNWYDKQMAAGLSDNEIGELELEEGK